MSKKQTVNGSPSLFPVFKLSFFFILSIALLLLSSTYAQSEEEKGEKKLKTVHSKLHLLHGRLSEEYPEQLMVATFLPEDAVVLELGGNVGRNSCVIASILKNPYNLVVAESSPSIAKQLQENRNHNGMHFHIEVAAISKVPLVQNFWSTIPSATDIPGYFRVNTITFADLEKKYNLTFDTLVVDCEGALYYMLRDDPSILKNIRLVIIENDFVDPQHYKDVAALFKANGLKLVYTKALEHVPTPLPCKDYFFQVWSK